jgi:hypothetical protein
VERRKERLIPKIVAQVALLVAHTSFRPIKTKVVAIQYQKKTYKRGSGLSVAFGISD